MPLLVEISSGNKEIFLLGYFNMDLLKSDSVKRICDHLDIFSSFNMLYHIILSTRLTETTSTIIDNFFFNSAECDPTSGNITHPISDHLPQFAVLKAPSVQSTPAAKDSFVRDWNNFNHNAYSLMNFVAWIGMFTPQIDAGDPNLAFDNLFNIVNGLLDKYPLKRIYIYNTERIRGAILTPEKVLQVRAP